MKINKIYETVAAVKANKKIKRNTKSSSKRVQTIQKKNIQNSGT